MMSLNRWIIALASAGFFIACSPASAQWQVPENSFAIGKGAGTGFASVLCTQAQIAIGQNAAKPICAALSGDATMNASGALTLATVNSNVGSFGSASNCVSFTTNAKGLITAASQTTCASALRSPNPTNLYVTKTGNDSNNCTLTGSSACLTIQRAVNVALANYDFQGATITINVGAGTYDEMVSVNGPIGGSGAPSAGLAKLHIVGAGSGTTSIAKSNCTGGAYAINANSFAVVGAGSITLSSNCAGGGDFVMQNGSIGYPVDDDLVFGAANTGALIYVLNGSAWDANFVGSKRITITGGANYGFNISTNSRAITGVGVTNVITGTPAFANAFVTGIVNASFVMGSSSSWSGSATGRRYALSLSSVIDTEQITTALPGSIQGTLQGLSVYYDNRNLACIGGAGGCPSATAPTGLGSGSAAMATGSNDHSGAAVLTAGAGAAASGTLVVSTNSILTGDWSGGGFCTVSLNNNASAWITTSTVQAYYDANGFLNISWNTNGAALSNGSSYRISYICS